MPPPTQGVAALEALAILAAATATRSARSGHRCGAGPRGRAGQRARRRRRHAPAGRRSRGRPPGAAPGRRGRAGRRHRVRLRRRRDGMAVSLLQSLYEGFGSGVVAGGTGIVLNNRAAGFALQGEVIAGDAALPHADPGHAHAGRACCVGPFGLMGGIIQAQSHTQFVCALMDGGDGPGDPQAALDRGRFRIDGGTLNLEPPLWDRAGELAGLGLTIRRATERGARSAAVRRSSSATAPCSAARTPARTAAPSGSSRRAGPGRSRRRGSPPELGRAARAFAAGSRCASLPSPRSPPVTRRSPRWTGRRPAAAGPRSRAR